MGAVSAAFEDELARLERSPSGRRLEERVERLLAGGSADDTPGWSTTSRPGISA
jgi:hypothetical protein